MGSFRAAAQTKIPAPEQISTRALIQQLGWTPPVSLLALIRELNIVSRSYHQDVVTPDGTPLGGWVDLNIQSNGNYQITFHMHSSSELGNFDFDLRAYLNVPNGPTFFFHHSGHVSGVNTAEYPESGSNPLIAMYWSEIAESANYTVAKDYQWGGAVGTLGRLADDLVNLRILDFGADVVGTALGAVIAVSQEAMGWIHANLGPGGTIAIVTGVAVFAVAAALGAEAGAALVFATVDGVEAGALSDLLIDSRPINQEEIAKATEVFGNTIPYDKVILTNLVGLGGRSFTAPGVDGKIYCNIGKAFINPLGSYNNAYPLAGQMLIHELTHAWQIAYAGFLPGLMCSAIVTQADFTFGDNVYQYGPAGPPWWSFNPEQQGAIVDQWFAGKQDGNTKQSAYDQKDSKLNPYYRYIRDDILQG